MTNTQLTPRDHLAVGIHAIFILFSLKLAFSNHMVISMVGWILAYFNLKSFDLYSMWRKDNARQR